MLVPLLLLGGLYWRGHRRAGRWRPVAFFAGLAVLLLALESPIDFLSQSLFWMHMVQHMLLLLVVAPLLVAGAPWLPLWQGLPGPVRRWLGPRAAPVLQTRLGQRLGRAATAPLVGLGLFAVDLWAWHLPVLFDLTLRNEAVHHVEHISFVVVGLFYWATVIDSP
ncbi:MAG TPA: cytochrome c oxidase assembly protein, partial [Candidatus Dormibacteraeota bacterium]|nr:cytochrome c oxidase assembly protein [Candidatus Dormibacteraeota bacterium]